MDSFLLSLLLLLFSQTAFASFPQPVVYTAYGANAPYCSGSSASPVALCSVKKSGYSTATSCTQYSSSVYVQNGVTGSDLAFHCYDASGSLLANVDVISMPASCPAGSTNTSGSCSCNTGYQQVSSSCVADLDNCSSKSGSLWPAPSSGGAWNSGTRKAYTFCPNTGGTTTCVVTGSSIYTAANGNNYIAGPWTYTGGLCASAGLGTGSETQAPTPCATGRCPGTLNGQPVCVACASITENKSTQVSTAASSAASGATTTTTTTSGSSSSSSTTCAGSQCTTTTTTTTQNPDGSTGQTATTKTEAKSDFCTTNPKAAACADTNGSFGGSCGSFVCDGDAVQCATAKAVQQSQCDSHIDQTDPMVTAGTNAIASDFSRGDPRNGGSVDVSSFDQTERYTGSCPADPVITVSGRSITVPLSRGCTYLGWLGQAAVAVCLIAAARIAMGGA